MGEGVNTDDSGDLTMPFEDEGSNHLAVGVGGRARGAGLSNGGGVKDTPSVLMLGRPLAFGGARD